MEIEKVAKISKLELSDEEKKKFEPQLEEVLKWFEEINKIETENIEPAFLPIEIENVWREDKVKAGLSQKEALMSTQHKKEGFFRGPKTLE